MTLDEVLAVAQQGARQGCTEALFTLGSPALWINRFVVQIKLLSGCTSLQDITHVQKCFRKQFKTLAERSRVIVGWLPLQSASSPCISLKSTFFADGQAV